ncbi:MAG: DUF2723 domain-containing protein, partial [Chloroflexota bacterium]|nr:DUF2723 domain-containing protein [Chloroflexota bacterium]
AFVSWWSFLSRVDWALTFLLFAASLALYARTLAPGLLPGDEGEFQVNIYRLGVSHTGYPFFFLFGKLFTLLVPVGTIATRANLFSAFWGALAVAAVYLVAQFLTRNRWAAILSALLFAASRVEWSQAVIPRPYTLNSLFVVVVTFLFFLWRVGKVDLTVPVFAFGLSLTNHRTMMWFAPAIALFVLIADYRQTFADQAAPRNLFAALRAWLTHSALFKPRRVLALVLAFVLPLLLYGYVFWRGDSDVGVEFHMKDFNEMILGGNSNRWMRYGPLDWVISRVTDLYLPLLIEQFTALGFVAGLIGMAALALDRAPRGWQRALPAREAFLFILLANIGNSAFCVFFWTIDVEKFFLPSYITFLFFIGVGIAIVWEWLAARFAARQWRRTARAVVVLGLIAAAVFLIDKNFPLNDWSNRNDAASSWDENLALPLEPHALIVGPWESLTPLEYAMYVDGRRTDLERWKVIVERDQLGLVLYGSRQQDIEHEVRAGRPVYLTLYPGDTQTLGALADEFRLTRVGGLWRVLNLPPQATPPPSTTIATFGDHAGHLIDLIGYVVSPAAAFRAGDFGLLTLFWRAAQSVNTRFTISFRLTDAQNRVVFQRDAEPANGQRPTIGWTDNEVVQDDIGFFVPSDAAPGKYQIVLVAYNSVTGEEMAVSGLGAFLRVVDLDVTPPGTQP